MWNTAAWNRARYSFYAPIYDMLAAPFRVGRQRAIAALHLRWRERILIVGCGTGLDLPFLPAASAITAIDLTPAMVRRTAMRAEQGGRLVHVAVMNGETLALPSASFDAVLLHLVLAVIPDPIACIREAARVLRPGGQISIFDKFLPDATHPSPVRQIANQATRILFSDINRQLGPMLNAAQLSRAWTEPAGLGGTYQVVVARRRLESC